MFLKAPFCSPPPVLLLRRRGRTMTNVRPSPDCSPEAIKQPPAKSEGLLHICSICLREREKRLQGQLGILFLPCSNVIERGRRKRGLPFFVLHLVNARPRREFGAKFPFLFPPLPRSSEASSRGPSRSRSGVAFKPRPSFFKWGRMSSPPRHVLISHMCLKRERKGTFFSFSLSGRAQQSQFGEWKAINFLPFPHLCSF